jgi:hypothetical protein
MGLGILQYWVNVKSGLAIRFNETYPWKTCYSIFPQFHDSMIEANAYIM